ncbi:tryptophan 7-halogenase [Aurantiacibacter hainanensis]|uniref:tryptophan 7-halogenase n=1 Tax=Aurantiacibacter hainanensis TaxID=3076114 RepID=UPI0030C6D07E
MSVPREQLRRIVVAGGGQVGILAAIGLRRALPRCEVVIIGLAPDPAAFADHAATALPFTNKLHDRLGIDESRIVLAAGGSYRLATRYFGWGGENQHGVATYGDASDAALQTRFAQEWGRGPRNVSERRQAASLAEVLVDAGRFAPPPPDSDTPLSQIEYALRWNPPAYRDLLIDLAQQSRISHVQGMVEAVERDGQGGIAAVVIEGQGRIEADFFVDCSGTAAVLASALPDFSLDEWTGTLPVRRVLVARPGQAMLALEDRVSLLPEGWLSELAGRDGLQMALAIGEGTSEEDAVRALGAEPVAAIPVTPTCLKQPWSGNVVALGDAAARFEPLAGLPLDLAHRQIDLLLEMLPGREIEPLERAEYNRRAAMMFDSVREVLALHYTAPRASRVFPGAAAPASVQTALDQYTRRGRLPFREESPFLKQERMALLGALGFDRGIPAQHRQSGSGETEAAQAEFEARAKAALSFAPPYDQWMASVLQPGAR